MKIVNSKLFFTKGAIDPQKGFLENAKNNWIVRRGICLAIWDENENLGLGETSPLLNYSPDTIEQCKDNLKDIHLHLPLVETNKNAIETIEFVIKETCKKKLLCKSAKFALETALLDLLAKKSNCSVASLIKNTPTFDNIAVNDLISFKNNFQDTIKKIETSINIGIKTFKFKIGAANISFEKELELLFVLKKRFDKDINLRLDVNGNWDLQVAIENLNKLKKINPQFVEEPVSGLEMFKCKQSNIPIAADESLMDDDFKNNVFNGDISVLILKPSILGGITQSYRLALKAFEMKMNIVVTHLFDGPIALAACREFAMGLPQKPLACGLALHSGLTIWPKMDKYLCIKNGVATSTLKKGLGIPQGFLEKLNKNEFKYF